MALALGLGSLFNHHPSSPNVKYTLDHESHSIKYETTREVGEGEELTISYGAGRMWWEPELSGEEKEREERERERREDPEMVALEMGRIGLSDDEPEEMVGRKEKSVVENGIELHPVPGPSKHFPPLYRLTAALDPSTMPLTTRDAWLIDIPPTSASSAVRFLQTHSSVLQNRDDGLHSTRHLRSFRTTPARTQFLICLSSAFPDRTHLIEWLSKEGKGIFGPHPEPYLGEVPVIGAPSRERLAEWQAVWPCIVRSTAKEVGAEVGLVDRKKDAAMWEEDGRLRWVRNRFLRVVALARHAQGQGEGRGRAIANAVHVTHPYDAAKGFVNHREMSWLDREYCNWSQLIGPKAPVVGRIFTSALNVDEKAQILETLRYSESKWATFNTSTSPLYSPPSSGGTIEADALDQRLHLRNPLKHAAIEAISRVSVLRTLDRTSPTTPPDATAVSNGSDYLLTSLSLFTLYEPCVYCTMALLHSRVSEIYFLLPSPGRGGCCGANLPSASKCEEGEDGGIYALQEQKGLNHSFTVWRYMDESLGGEKVRDLAREFDIGLLDP